MISELAEFAIIQFKLSAIQKDGASLREHLMVAFNATGIKQAELAEETEVPPLMAHAWKYFNELHRERTSNGMGPNYINSTGIKHWCQVNRITLDHWDIEAIKTLDKLWMDSLNV